jgi:hypothetical protein
MIDPSKVNVRIKMIIIIVLKSHPISLFGTTSSYESK